MITYRLDPPLEPAVLASLFRRSGLRRPVDDLERIQRMIVHADSLWTAWDGDALIGVARSLTDFAFCCYLSDLAVDRDWQRRGVGLELVRRLRQQLGSQVTLLLLSAPEAMAYYPRIGFDPVPNGWIINRRA